MTVSTTSNKITYPGNGSTTSFSFPFPGVATSDIQVFTTSPFGVVTQLATNQYSVVLNAAIAPNPTGVGGSVNYPLTGSPLPLGWFITILRTLPQTQPTSLANQSILYQTVIESMLDYVTMLSQQNAELYGRALVVQPSDPVPTPLPAAAARANLLMGFDSSGNPIALAGVVSNVIVSSVMQPVVTASTLANARTALGVQTPGLGLQTSVLGGGAFDVNVKITHEAGNFTADTAHHMGRYVMDGPGNISLPLASQTWNGFGFWVSNQAHAVNLLPNAGDSINGGGLGVPASLLFNSTTNSWFVSTDGVNQWYF